nr:unnamed protein product [Callosobruchus analis]
MTYMTICKPLKRLLGLPSPKRSADDEEVLICQGRTPCGWALYNKTNRYIYDFMKNRCTCDGDKKCVRDYDDISISSYVYRCKVEELKPTES